jgi:hypothetical protein
MIKNIFLLQTLTKVFISRILINFYNINHIKNFSAKKSSEAVASLPQWKLRHWASNTMRLVPTYNKIIQLLIIAFVQNNKKIQLLIIGFVENNKTIQLLIIGFVQNNK